MAHFAMLAAGERPPTTAVLAFLEGLAAEMEGVDEAVLVADATRWANALPRAALLVGSPAIALGAEACQAGLRPALVAGRAAPVEALVETLARLAETQRGSRDLVVRVPGPGRLLAAGMDAGAARTALVGLMERLCACRPALVLLDERDDGLLDGPDCRRFAGTLKNVADYYGVALGLQLEAVSDPIAAIAARRKLRLDHLLLADACADPAACRRAAGQAGWRSLGLAGEPVALPPAAPGEAWHWFALAGSVRDIGMLKRACAVAG